MMKGDMDQQISYLTVIVVHSTMHLMHHNHCQMLLLYYMYVCGCVCVYIYLYMDVYTIDLQ